MKGHEFKVNGVTLVSKERQADAAVLLRLAFKGKAILEDPDKTPYVLRVPNKEGVTFVAGQTVDLDEYSAFRADPDKGGFA